MSYILWLSSLRYLMRHPWQVGLSVLGVAAGVAVVVAINLANQSAHRAFALSTEAVAGRATHQIVGGPFGIPEEVYRRLRVDEGIREIAPMVEGYISAPGHSGLTFRLIGVDIFAEDPFRSYLNASDGDGGISIQDFLMIPGAGVLAAETAGDMGLNTGDSFDISFSGVTHAITLVGTVDTSGDANREAIKDLLITDISTAQEFLNSIGRISRIDLVIPETKEGAVRLERIQSALPQGVRVARTESRNQGVEQMTRAFSLNLTALSLLALVVGTFLIYNTMTFSVVRRRTLIGTLRAIGVTREQIFTLMLGEALIIGLVSSALGVVLGILLAQGLVQLITRTINDLFFVVSVRELAIGPLLIVQGLALGVGTALVAAAVPALEATTVPTRAALARSTIEARIRRAVPIATWAGILTLLVAIGILLLPTRNLVLSFGGLFALILGFAMLTPLATILFIKITSPIATLFFGLSGSMSVRGVTASLSRTSVAIAALTVAVSITVGMGIMIGSFRQTVEVWLQSALRADVFISPPNVASSRPNASVDSIVLERILSSPGVARASMYRAAVIDSPFGEVELIALDTSPDIFARVIQFKQGDAKSIWEDFQEGNAIIASEPFAYHNDVGVGESLSFLTNKGVQTFRVAGIYYDYSSTQGALMMSRPVYELLWDDSNISSVALYATQGTDPDSLIASLRKLTAPDQELLIRSNRTLREGSLALFDQTFAITSVLRMLAMIVAFIGVLSALMALQLERTREISTLRAIGLTPRQVWGIVTSQTALMGLIAGLLALPVGIALAYGLVHVVNRRSFGWTMPVHISPDVFLEALALAVVGAFLAGLYPAFRMARSEVSEALREE